MKRTIKTILCAAIVVLATASCQKSIEPANQAEESKGTIDVRINGLMGEYTQVDGTKADLVNTVRVSWKGGETVYVYDGTQCLGSLVASLEGDEDRYALLSTDESTHTVNTPADGTTKLTLVYSPLLTKAPAVSEGTISISLADQNNTTAPFVAYATLDYTGTAITDAVVPFKFATSVIKVNCTGLTANTAIDNATLSNVNTACKLTLSGGAAPIVSGDVNGTITRTGDAQFDAGKVNAEGQAVFQVATPALVTASEARVLTVAQGSNNFEYKKFSTKSLSAATSVNTVCQLVKNKPLPAGALPGVFSVSNDGGKHVIQVLFSQGNLWYGKNGDAQTATFNFETNQYYFASEWDADHVSHFYWSKTASVAYAESYSESGTTVRDVFFTNTIETSAKDGFTVNVDGEAQSDWRTLSTNEWNYLFDTRSVNGGTGIGHSYSTGITYNNKPGLVLYPDDYDDTPLNPGDNVLELPEGAVFLPIAGQRENSDVTNFSSGYISGGYWASTADNPYFSADCAYQILFNYNSIDTQASDCRYTARSVRLVIEI